MHVQQIMGTIVTNKLTQLGPITITNSTLNPLFPLYILTLECIFSILLSIHFCF